MSDFTDEEEAAMKKIILEQDIQYYHEYMESLKSKFIALESREQSYLMDVYNATESVWVALLNLRKQLEK